jgi:putative membrane protein
VVRRALATLGAALAPSLALAHEGDAHGAVDLWRAYGFDLYVVLPMLLAAGIYGAGVARLWRRAGRGRGVETWRAGCFAGAMLALGLALIWPFDVLGGMILSAHMVQHLLLTTAAAPLLALSAPLAAGLWALPRAARRAAGGVAHAAGMRRGWTLLTLPLFAWAFYAASLWLWHMPRFYEAAARDELVHILEHLCFLASAMVLWWTALLSARTSALGVVPASSFCSRPPSRTACSARCWRSRRGRSMASTQRTRTSWGSTLWPTSSWAASSCGSSAG